jgi:protoporphyrinogen oxidase
MEKTEIAIKQLRASAKLYKAGDYISSLTLAGAAEEILGKIAENRTGTNEMKKEIIYLKGIYQSFNKEIPDDKILKARINKSKNEVKHNDSRENSWVDGDFENETVLLFVKSVKNYFNAYNKMPNDRIIMNLFEFFTL